MACRHRQSSSSCVVAAIVGRGDRRGRAAIDGLVSRETRKRDDRARRRRPGNRRCRRRPSSRRPAANGPTRPVRTLGGAPAPAPRRASSSRSRSTRRSSASPAASSSTAACSPPSVSASPASAPAMLAFLWPFGSGGFGGKVKVDKTSPTSRRTSRRTARRTTCRSRARTSSRIRPPTSPRPRRSTTRRHLPAWNRASSRSTSAACTSVAACRSAELAVVRVPVPRLEVQPRR